MEMHHRSDCRWSGQCSRCGKDHKEVVCGKNPNSKLIREPVVNSFSGQRGNAHMMTGVPRTGMPLIAVLDRTGITFCYVGVAHEETKMLIQSSLRERVREAQLHDRLLREVRKRIEVGRPREFTMEEDATIFFRGRLCAPQKSKVKMNILKEAHRTPYMVQLGEIKTY
jgi:hypothetical protein